MNALCEARGSLSEAEAELAVAMDEIVGQLTGRGHSKHLAVNFQVQP